MMQSSPSEILNFSLQLLKFQLNKIHFADHEVLKELRFQLQLLGVTTKNLE